MVPEKSMETLRDDLDSLKRKFDLVMEGKEPDGSGTVLEVLHQRNQGHMILINHQMLEFQNWSEGKGWMSEEK